MVNAPSFFPTFVHSNLSEHISHKVLFCCVSTGMMFTNGPVWTEQRKFALRTLRDFGFGRKSMESLVHTELVYLNDALSARAGNGAVATNDLIQTCVLNCLWTMMAGKRFSKSDETIINTFHELS